MYSKYIFVVLSCVVVCVLSRPSDAPEKQQPTVIPIVSQSDELEPNGTYKFSYETGNGIKREEIAYDKVLPKRKSGGKSDDSSNEGGEDDNDSNEIHVQQGSYSYTAPDGTVITVRYIADENGFQLIGDHIPRVPVASPASNSGEKSGRSLNTDIKTNGGSTPVKAGLSEKPVKVEPQAALASLSTPIEDKTTLSAKAKPETESNEATTAKVDVSTDAASTAAPDQPSTETDQASTASAEQASTSTSEQTVKAEDSDNLSSTSAPEESSTTEAVGQSTTSEPIDKTTTEEIEQSTTSQPSSAEESSSTTISA